MFLFPENWPHYFLLLLSCCLVLLFFLVKGLSLLDRFFDRIKIENKIKHYNCSSGSVYAYHCRNNWPKMNNNKSLTMIDTDRDYVQYGSVDLGSFPMYGELFNETVSLNIIGHDGKFCYYKTNIKARYGLSGTPLLDSKGKLISVITHFVNSEIWHGGTIFTDDYSVIAFPIISMNQINCDIPLILPPRGCVIKTTILSKLDKFIISLDAQFNSQRFNAMTKDFGELLNGYSERIFGLFNSIFLFETTPIQLFNMAKFIPTFVLISSILNVIFSKLMISTLKSKDWYGFFLYSVLYLVSAFFSLVTTVGSIGTLNSAISILTLSILIIGIINFLIIEEEGDESRLNFKQNTNEFDIGVMEICLMILCFIPLAAYFEIPFFKTIYYRIEYFFLSCIDRIYIVKDDRYVNEVMLKISQYVSVHGSSAINSVGIYIGKALSLIPDVSKMDTFHPLDFLFRGRDSMTTKTYLSYILDPDFANFLFILYWFTIYRVNGLITEPPANVDRGFTWDVVAKWLIIGPTIEYAAVTKCIILSYIAASYRSIWFMPIAIFISNCICFAHLRTVLQMHAIKAEAHKTHYANNYIQEVNEHMICGRDIISNVVALTTGLSVVIGYWMECYWFSFMCLATTLVMFYSPRQLVDSCSLLFFIIDSPIMIIIFLITSYKIPNTWLTSCRFRLPPYPKPKMTSGTGVRND